MNDSYVVVGGCPEPDEHHAREVAMMGIDMMDTMDSIDHPVTGGPLTDQVCLDYWSLMQLMSLDLRVYSFE